MTQLYLDSLSLENFDEMTLEEFDTLVLLGEDMVPDPIEDVGLAGGLRVALSVSL